MMDQLNKTEDLVRIEGLTKIFGRHHRKAAELFKAGKTRERYIKQLSAVSVFTTSISPSAAANFLW